MIEELNIDEEKICQSCAMPLTNDILGTNANGTLSDYYCKYCFENGEFIEDLTLEQAILSIGNIAEEAGVTREEAIGYASRHLPDLMRWKNDN